MWPALDNTTLNNTTLPCTKLHYTAHALIVPHVLALHALRILPHAHVGILQASRVPVGLVASIGIAFKVRRSKLWYSRTYNNIYPSTVTIVISSNEMLFKFSAANDSTTMNWKGALSVCVLWIRFYNSAECSLYNKYKCNGSF